MFDPLTNIAAEVPMTDEVNDPFEKFRKEKEKEEQGKKEEENDENNVDAPAESNRSDRDSPESENVIQALKKYSRKEGRPEGYWSHRFEFDALDSDEVRKKGEEKPDEFSSHRLTPEEQNEINKEARDGAAPPEGLKYHRMEPDSREENQNPDEDEPDDSGTDESSSH